MHKKLIFLVLLIGLSIPNLFGQFCPNPPTCLSNGELEPNDPNATGNINTTWANTVPGWSASHGTPSLTGGFSGSGVWMWSRTSGGTPNGEGIFACYNFQQGHEYQICFRVMNTNANNQGNLFVRAVNNLVPAGGSVIPAVPVSSQIIHSTHVHSSTWVQHSIPFTPSTNYSGVWIYPFSPVDFVNGLQYELAVDEIWINEAQPSNIAVTASQSTIDGCGSTVLSVSNALPGTTYRWFPATGLSSTSGSSVTASPCQTTTYNVEIINPCTNSPCLPSIQRQVTVTVNPNVSVSASTNNINVCGSATLTASSANAMNVTWSPSAGLSSTSGNVVTASPCKTTTYTASFYCPQNGCTYTDQVTINVQPNGGIVNNSSPNCYGNIDLEYVSTPPCTGATYQWYNPSNTLVSTSSKFIKGTSTLNDQGTYTLIVTTPQGCVDTFYTIVIMNCCKVVADFNIIDCNPVRFENTTLDSIGGDTVLQAEWFWDLGDGTTSTLRNPSHLNVMDLSHRTVCLTAVVSTGFSTCCAKICKEFDPCDNNSCPKAAFDFRVLNPGAVDVQLMDKSVGGGTPCVWEWEVDGIPVPGNTDPTPIISGITPGEHYVCLKVTYCLINGQTCDETWCEKIVIP